jgi:5-methylcytosine-specific restriction endonuclease McrBC regulatory subunit McrC
VKRVTVYENEPFPVRRDQEKALQRVLAGRLKRVTRDKLRITGVAGHVRLSNGELWNIRSRKADAVCLLTWLAYADPVLDALRLLDSLPEQTQAGDLGPLVARAFCVATWRAIQTSGLLRAYHRQHIRSPVIRGRIDFARMAHTGGDLSRTPCIVFSRLPQTPLNRLLAATVERIRRDPVLRLAAGASLPPLAAALAEIPPIVDTALLSARIPLSRLEQPFESSYALACLIVRSTGMASGKELDGLSFLVDLANLFERAVARAFHDSPFETRSKHPIHLLRESPATRLTKAIPMQLDVYLPNVHGHRVVVDAKYKTRIATANLQQMITYCVATGAQHAVLVFPAGHLDDRRTYLLVPPHSDAAPLRIHIVEFDLTQTKLAGWHEAGRRVAAEVEQKVLGSAPSHSPAESRPQTT